MSWRHVFKTSWRSLQRNNFLSSKTTWRRLQDVLRNVFKMFSRRLENVLKTNKCLLGRLYKLFYEAMLRIIIFMAKKTNLVPPFHLDDLFKSISNRGLNSETRFLAFQIILYDEDFSEYVKSLFKLQESDNHVVKCILSIMNMIEILLMNIGSLRTKDWNNFSSLRLMMPWMIVYDNTNYSQWLPVFWMEMSSLSQEHCQLIKEIFS